MVREVVRVGADVIKFATTGGAASRPGHGPKDIEFGPDELRIAPLEERVRAGGIKEVVLATNPTTEGDATAHFIPERLRDSGVLLTRIAYGMPLGADLEYADQVTIGLSVENRRGID